MPRRPSKGAKGAKASKGAASKPRGVNREDAKMKKWNKASDVPMDEEDHFHSSRDKILLNGDAEGDDDWKKTGMELDEEPQPKSSKKKKTKGNAAPVSESSDGDSEEEEGWGRGKAAYYSSNAAQLESDDDEGNALEEQEAIRLQGQLRQEMDEGDFGIDDALEAENQGDEEAERFHVEPVLPTDPKSLMKHLARTDPESLALAQDWSDTALSLVKTQGKDSQQEQEQEHDGGSLGMSHLYHQTLLSYATTLAFYLYLRADEKYTRRPELLKKHPILGRLLTLKQSLNTLEELDFAFSDEEDEDFDGDGDEDDEDMLMDDAEMLWSSNPRGKSLESGELDALLSEALSIREAEISGLKPKSKKSKSEPLASSEPPPAKKRKTSKPTEPNHVFDLVEPEFVSSKASSSRSKAESSDAYGEATTLQYADAADKSARQKSLRFHTSKIESASARRQAAKNNALGGDQDIPYRERQKEKEARAAREAKARVKHQGGQDLDDVDPLPKSKEKRKDTEGSDDDMDGYYDLVQRAAKEKKEKKNRGMEDDTASGPRSLTRAILANKGLTPHRPKSVRNPRVKKKLKFEKAKKKISSQKAIYKGGVGDSGRYEGEKSGISRVVKSVRLS
ncbi:Sas10 C-terminal domain-containing protein [Mycena floridula]|nr:Sas10 C-terminal domain-containing protein [Mycena floridula]